MLTTQWAEICASGLLTTAVVCDIKWGKFPNWLFLVSCFFAFVFWLFHITPIALGTKVLASILLLIGLMPLFYIKALGAGDIKLLSAFSLFTSWLIALDVLIYSLYWGLLIAALKLLVSGDLYRYIKQKAPFTSNKIPYTVALLLGWGSYLHVGGSL